MALVARDGTRHFLRPLEIGIDPYAASWHDLF
jgi:hypothetical protein